MRIGLQTWGTDGDILPFIALANALKKRGVRVVLAYTSIDGKEYHSEGIEMIPANDAVNFNPPPNPYSMGKKAGSFGEYSALVENYFDPFTDSMYLASEQLCKTSDVVIGHSICHTLATASQVTNTQRIVVALAPMVVRSNTISPIGTNLGKLINASMWSIGDAASTKLWFKRGREIRKGLGLKPIQSLQKEVFTSHLLTLVSCSPNLVKTPKDWGDHIKMPGFFSTSSSMDSNISHDLETFLNDEEEPVYMTFGSCMQYHPRLFTEMLVSAAKESGVRAIIQTEYEHPEFEKDHRLFRVRKSPHAELFPRCCMIVHHGGAGTTQSALKAGKPSIVVSHGFDQPFWAELLFRAGVGGIPMSVDMVHPNDLAENICKVTSDKQVNKKAASIGKNLKYEKGVEKAVDLILEKMPS